MIAIATILNKGGSNRRTKFILDSISSASSGRRPDLAQNPNSIRIKDVENLILFFRYFGPDMDTIFKFFSNNSSIDRRTSSQLRDLYYYENCDWMARIFRGLAGVAFTQSVMSTLLPTIIQRDSFTNIIDRAFTWSETPEGFGYWQRLHRLFGIFYRNVVPEIENDVNFRSMRYMDDVILSKISREFGSLSRDITYYQTFGQVYHFIETEAPDIMDLPDLAQTSAIRAEPVAYNPLDHLDEFIVSTGSAAMSAGTI